jgi:CPA2 family monovalent cation:H+ antiporter-2
MLLGLFFIAVGASVNFKLILNNPLLIAALVAGTIFIKALVLHIAGKAARLSFDQNTVFTLALSQVGEFAFVLFGFIAQLGLLSSYWVDIMMGVTATSMTVTPLLLLISERLILPFFGTKEAVQEREPDQIQEEHPVIITGFGHFGSTIGRFLRASGVSATILDNDSDRVDLLRKMGFKVFYGDATRIDILKAAGAEKARILIAAIDSPEINMDLVKRTKAEFPHLTIMVRARNRLDAYELLDEGITNVYRESLETSVRIGVDVLVKLGFRRYSATRAGQNFIKYDEAALPVLAAHRHDQERYIFNTREQVSIQEELLTNDREANPTINDHAWDREEY